MALLAQLVDDVVVSRFEIDKDSLTLGRAPSNDVQIDDESVSGKHAAVHAQDNPHFKGYQEFFLEDLNSTNGTFVNDDKVRGRVRLHHNDVIRLAWNRFKFIDDMEGELEKTRHMINPEG